MEWEVRRHIPGGWVTEQYRNKCGISLRIGWHCWRKSWQHCEAGNKAGG